MTQEKMCIGCGFCCIKAPCCYSPRVEPWRGCLYLCWHDGRHWCGVIEGAAGSQEARLKKDLSIGAGCCAGLNTWRYEPLVDRRLTMYPAPGHIPEDTRKEILKDLKKLINFHSMDVFSNTPEHVLAEFLFDCFVAYSKAIKARRNIEEDVY